MSFPIESVTVQRTGRALPGLVDPLERRVYLESGSDVRAGDVLAFRGYTRRVVAEPMVWASAGVVVEFEDASPLLPDLGQLLRPTGGLGPIDEETGLRIPPDAPVVWSGACLVEPAQSDGSIPEIGDQQVGVVPFTVEVPLALSDVRTGDVFKVTQSRDARLLVRLLVVKAVRASSTATTRTLLAFDNQGG